MLFRAGSEITFREIRLYTFSHEFTAKKGLVEGLLVRSGSEAVAVQFQEVMRDLWFSVEDSTNLFCLR